MQQFDAESDELGKIDYFLNQLARAVERGEVPMASYEALAPRYLACRADLVAVLRRRNERLIAGSMGEPAQSFSAEQPSRASAPTGGPSGAPVPVRSADSFPAPSTVPAMAAGQPTAAIASPPIAYSPEAAPVPWTTILLFLGAFLVIVASAIFAVAVWDVMPVSGKLAFLGTLTAAFYVAGWWARVKLDLKVGATALTTVASAMLLFDGWIAISGYDLHGPLPWAILLLGCSIAYWITEIRLEDRFFGVIGAAAQLGWWWLLMLELDWAVPARIAGIAVVALVWQLASVRSKGNESLSSLTTILMWAAPVVAVGAVAALFPAIMFGSLTLADVASAAIACACGLAVVWMTDLVPSRDAKRIIGAAIQLPLFVYAWTVSLGSGASWWLVGTFVVMAIAYELIAFYFFGAPFAVAGLLAELSIVVELCALFDASTVAYVCAVAAVSALWMVAARVTRQLAPGTEQAVLLGETSFVAEIGAYAVLAAACLVMVVLAILTGDALDHAVESIALLAAWGLGLAVHRRVAVLFVTSAWSFYTAFALLAWFAPNASPGAVAAGLLGVAAVWLASSRLLGHVWESTVTEAFAWTMRAAVLVITVGGVLSEILAHAGTSTYWSAGLTLAAGLIFALDAAVLDMPPSAAAGAFLAVTGAFQLGVAVVAPVQGEPALKVAWSAGLSASAMALAIVSAAAILRGRAKLRAQAAAIAASAGLLVCSVVVSDHSSVLAAVLALAAVSWGISALPVGQYAIFPAALSGVGAACAALSATKATPTETIAVLATVGILLGLPTLARTFGPGGRWEGAGLGLVGAGIIAEAALIPLGVESVLDPGGAWWQVGKQGIAIGLFALAASFLVQGAVRHLEAAYYVGFGAMLLGLWAELNASNLDRIEFYSTTLAVYLIVVGLVYIAFGNDREFPVALDWIAMLAALGVPLIASLLTAGSEPTGLSHVLWTVGISLLAIGAGVLFKVRAYFFCGVFALAAVAFYRSFFALASFWWLWLGLLGVLLLVVALTWERQRMLVARVQLSLEGWR